MKLINFAVTVDELRLLASLASDQLFRRQFIDPKMPGYKGKPEEVDIGKALVRRMLLIIDGGTPPYHAHSASSKKGDHMKNIFVGNLNSVTTPEAVRSLFEPLGTIRSFKLMTDRDSGLSRGFAFIEMTEVEAGPAIAALDGRIVDGRTIEVREGRSKLHRRGASPQRGSPQRSQPPLP